MNAVAVLAVAALAAGAGAAQPVPGLAEARLLPGWVTPDGARVTALEVRLEPGWNTYWRVPGDSGIPPRFDWSGPVEADYLWPAPQVIDSDGARVLGYRDALLLPIMLTGPGADGPLSADVLLGLCETICVPAELTLTAAAPGSQPDPAIAAALAAVPQTGAVQPDCVVTAIADGVRVAASLPHEGTEAPEAAMELVAAGDGAGGGEGEDGGEGAGDVWVSAPEVTVAAGRLTATADFVPPSGKPFPLDPARLRLTLVGEGRALEVSGCRPG